jgi:hypothetical protein
MFGSKVPQPKLYPYLWTLGIVGVGGIVAVASTGAFGNTMGRVKHHLANSDCVKMLGCTKKTPPRLKFWAS